jgi:hypothetical protein
VVCARLQIAGAGSHSGAPGLCVAWLGSDTAPQLSGRRRGPTLAGKGFVCEALRG